MSKYRVYGPEGRPAALERRRLRKMARSAHGYVRGNTRHFYRWLDEMPDLVLPETQPIWICGDCHVENLGALAGCGGEVAVQIRDFDQTVVGHPGHDLLRLCLSLASAARSSDLPGTVTAQMVEAVVRNYALALARGRRDEIPTAPKLIEATQRCAFDRTWKHLAKDRLKHRRPTIDHGKKFWPLAPEEHASIVAMFAQPAMRDLVLKLHRRGSEAEIEVVDAAYWVKGCSSLELLRYAAIIGIHDGSGEPRYALFDIKEAEASVAPAARPDAMPNDPAERVVAGARALSPILGERMAAGRIMDRPVFVRELLPQDLKIEVDQFASKPAVAVAGYLAYVVGDSHANLMGAETRKTWRKEVRRRGTREVDAPDWLWNGLVAMVGRHEAGYLDHCCGHDLVYRH
ncbi:MULTISPECIES: DUF2252 family protein [Methylobacterium]|uniref:Protein of unassigned function n=1 Tax=Methylobacterium oryzae CBMB20 TaxID=693986 RepID=A0A088B392_9HYPH|nr:MULTISPECIES: DUF2252 family protein [Methylobacterium]AGO88354.1 protein of unassigned function [Methylobacterium oryzae CBMB20]WFS05439.1 DUF2252 family protein [Methylobacterium sp. 391_Methyba4]